MVLSVVIMLTVSFFNISFASQSEETVKAHQKAIQAIENWLNKIPKERYEKAQSEDIFQWKLSIEENQDKCERFQLYNKLLEEIGNKKFVYNASIFNTKTIRYYQLSLYYSCYKSQGGVEPSQFLSSIYSFYKGHINSKNEQWIWLDQFLSFLGGGRFGEDRPKLSSELASNSYGVISNMLKEYLFISDHIVKNNSELIKNKDIFYTENPGAWATYNSENVVLKRIYNFVKMFQGYLKESEKEAIKKFLLPTYQEQDYTVKIYSILRKE